MFKGIKIFIFSYIKNLYMYIIYDSENLQNKKMYKIFYFLQKKLYR